MRVVAYTTAPWDHVQTVIRLGSPYRAAGIQLIQGNLDGQIFPERVTDADLVLIQRDFPVHFQAYQQILSQARLQSKPVIYDIDDLLLQLPLNHPDRLSQYYAMALFPMLHCILEADGITAISAPLADFLRPLNPNVWVLHNFLDDGIWDLSPMTEEVDDGVVTIGYMGGDSHIPDFELVIPTLVELLQRYRDRLALKLVGLSPFSPLREMPNVTWIPFQLNYSDYTRFASQQNFDLMIAPERDILFNRCKGSVKFQEASALSLPGVYSDTLPFRDQVRQGENGFLANNPAEWKSFLIQLIEDKSLRRRMGLAALQTLRDEWVLSKNAHRWLDIYGQILSGAGKHQPVATISSRLFMDLNDQTQAWLQAVNGELKQARLLAQQTQETLLAKEGYISALHAQIAAYRDSLPGKLLRATRQALSVFRSR